MASLLGARIRQRTNSTNYDSAHSDMSSNLGFRRGRIRKAAASSRTEDGRVAMIRNRVRRAFTTEYNLKFQKYVGDGSHGGTGVFARWDPINARLIASERYIVKFSLGILPNGEDSDAHLMNEINWLKRFSGSEHFITTRNIQGLGVFQGMHSAATGGGSDADPVGEGSYARNDSTGDHDRKGDDKSQYEYGDPSNEYNNNCNNRITANAQSDNGNSHHDERDQSSDSSDDSNDSCDTEFGTGIVANIAQLNIRAPAEDDSDDDGDDEDHDPTPSVVLDYLPLGDLHSLRERFVAHGDKVPSRLLWAFALCLVRMCIGMAYYHRVRPGQREEIPDGERPSIVAHHSIKTPNILIDDLKPEDGEHSMVPLLKLIDFGRTGYDYKDRTPYTDGAGVFGNLFYIGLVIETLSSTTTRLEPGCTWIPQAVPWPWRDQDTGQVMFYTRSSFRFCADSSTHLGLRIFVARLMSSETTATIPMVRPTLREALDICLRHVRMTPAEMWNSSPVPEGETDEALRRYIRDIVLNAALLAPAAINTGP